MPYIDVQSYFLPKVHDNNDRLSYWLSNASTLLLLLQRTLKASGAASLTPQRRRSTSSSLLGRMSQVRDLFYFIFQFEVALLLHVVWLGNSLYSLILHIYLFLIKISGSSSFSTECWDPVP